MRFGGNSVRSASSTTRAECDVPSTLASTPVNWTCVNGSPSTMSSSAVVAAIVPGRRMTQRDSRYQKPDSSPTASRCAAARQRSGASAFDARAERRQQRGQHRQRDDAPRRA